VTSGTAIASGSSTSSALSKPTIKDTRATAARGRMAPNRGRGGRSTRSQARLKYAISHIDTESVGLAVTEFQGQCTPTLNARFTENYPTTFKKL